MLFLTSITLAGFAAWSPDAQVVYPLTTSSCCLNSEARASDRSLCVCICTLSWSLYLVIIQLEHLTILQRVFCMWTCLDALLQCVVLCMYSGDTRHLREFNLRVYRLMHLKLLNDLNYCEWASE